MSERRFVGETRKIAAILVSDVVGYSRLAGADEDGTLSRLRGLRSDLIDPAVAVHHGRVVKRTGDGSLVEFRSVVDAVRCAIEVQNGLVERNVGVAPDKRIEFRIGIHLGDVVEEADGDLMGDGVNIAARIESVAKPGGICLSEDAYRLVRDKLKEEFVDLGEQALKNIARPVRVYALRIGRENPVSPEASPSENLDPPHLSIVVLPFANMSGNASQDYFADGVTGSLTTDLSRMPGMLVIGRNSAMFYKGKSVDLREIGRELNVRYILQGSVQRARKRVRVNVQLLEAATGLHLWAERFEKPLADLFELQDEIVARLANTLNVELIAAEARRAERAPSPDAMDLYFRGMAWLNRGASPEYFSQARSFFEGALTLDQHCVDALAGIAFADAHVVAGFIADDRTKHLASAEAAAAKALSLAPDHALAHVSMAIILAYTNRAERAIAECERALALDRNLAIAHAIIGLAKAFAGRAEETEAHVHEAIRLSPRDPTAFGWLSIVGYADICLGRNEEAAMWLTQSVETNRNYPNAQFWLAGVLAHLDRMDEARSTARTALGLDPKFTIARLRTHSVQDNPSYQARRRAIRDGMRKAGVPDE
jgi:TolB-like protein